MYTAAIMKTELEASKGTRKLDMRIDNIQLVNVFTREIYPASIGIYNESCLLYTSPSPRDW